MSRPLVIWIGLTIIGMVGFQFAMTFGFAGAWVAPYATLIEVVGTISGLLALVGVFGVGITLFLQNRRG
jgi:hypothetical protein